MGIIFQAILAIAAIVTGIALILFQKKIVNAQRRLAAKQKAHIFKRIATEQSLDSRLLGVLLGIGFIVGGIVTLLRLF